MSVESALASCSMLDWIGSWAWTGSCFGVCQAVTGKMSRCHRFGGPAAGHRMRSRLWLSGAGFLIALSAGVLVILRPSAHEEWVTLREDMVRQQVVARGVHDPLVVAAMRAVPRHLLVEEPDRAYQDTAVPIGCGQTTPQPYLVALMAELLEVGPGDRVLEIGTGSGYQAAVLAAMGVDTFSVEIHPQLCERATWNLRHLGFARVHVRCGDGSRGWPEEAPFDGILVTASGTRIPETLLTQLGQGGHMVIPVGEGVYQDLKVVIRTGSGLEEHSVLPVSFGELARGARARRPTAQP